MYHEFIENDDGRVNKKVHEAISFYQNYGIYGSQQSILDL